MSIKKNFPKGFLWGTATAAHQVEGNMENDWTKWEKKTAKNKAKNPEEEIKKQSYYLGKYPKKYLSSIRDITHDRPNYISGDATNHRNIYKKDFKLLKKIGLNSYRFSIEWSKVEPEEGKFDQQAIKFYREYIQSLKKLQITPMVTLWHFTSPIWFADKGGWQKSKNIKYFLRFVSKIVEEFQDEIELWVTLNEPIGYTATSTLQGIFPPNKKNIFAAIKTYRNFREAHIGSYKVIKNINPDLKVGIAKNNSYFVAGDSSLLTEKVTTFIRDLNNFKFLNDIEDYLDFIGLNFYNTIIINKKKILNFLLGRIGEMSFPDKYKEMETSDLGWFLNPEGFEYVLADLKRYKKPIYITEHGLADAEDKYRKWYIIESLKKIKRQMDNGADIRGYFHWSLLDNFEWDKGFWPRFGLIEVDYETYDRSVRESARVFG